METSESAARSKILNVYFAFLGQNECK